MAVKRKFWTARLLTQRPEGIVASGLVANAVGSFIGTLILAFAFRAENQFTQISDVSIGAIAGLSFYAFLVGLFWVFAYAAPIMALMRRLGFGGPVVALLTGALPAVVAAFLDPGNPVGLLAVYGCSVAVVFCLFAYSRLFSIK